MKINIGICARCNREKVYKHKAKKLCASCFMWTWYTANKHRPEIKLGIRRRAQRRRAKNRLEAITFLGGKCACCGESQYEFLCIDHIKGGGAAERRKDTEICRLVMKAGCPIDKYRLLCHNCNLALGFYGHCPHGNVPKAEYRPNLVYTDLVPYRV